MKFYPVSLLSAAIFLAGTASVSANEFSRGFISENKFNPAISLILDGRYTYMDDDIEFELPGYQLGGEAGLDDPGFTTGHNELTLSANVDDKFFAKFTTAIVQEDGETVVEGEEAFLETLGLGNGLVIRAGQFFSGIGYLNQQHEHVYDFIDDPLVYQAMFGGSLIDTGIQARWLAPTDFYLELGAEALNGSSFPGGESEDGVSAGTAFIKTGGDIGDSSSWQLGFSHYASTFDAREGGAHSHGGEEEEGAELTLNNGDVSINGIDFIYKWAPNGNPSERNFKFQAEYFQRDEDGNLTLTEDDDVTSASFDAEQSGFYLAAVYQFMPKWRVGVRYDQITSDNTIGTATGADPAEFDEDTESLQSPKNDPESISLMIDYTNSEFSRLRFQVSDVDYGQEDGEVLDGRVYTVQYILSLGAHGAHRF